MYQTSLELYSRSRQGNIKVNGVEQQGCGMYEILCKEVSWQQILAFVPLSMNTWSLSTPLHLSSSTSICFVLIG